MKTICMLVFNEMISDARVYKEADTLGLNGFQVYVLAFKNKAQPIIETKNNYLVIHIPLLLRKKNSIFIQLFLLIEIFIKFLKIILRLKPHVIHCHDILPMYIAWAGSKILNCKLLYDSHELEYDRNVSKKLRNINKVYEKLFINRVDQVIVSDGRFRAKIMVEKSGCKKPITYIKNCFPKVNINNAEKINLRKALGLDLSAKILLYIGNFMEGRGIKITLSLLIDDPQIVFVVLGQDYSHILKTYPEYHKVASRIIFMEPVSYLDIPKYCFGADVGCALIENVCLSYYYSLPTKIFDYIACGIPVIASNFPAITELVEHNPIGPIGVCVNPMSKSEISSGIAKIMDRDNYQFYKKNTHLVSTNLYNWNKEAKKLVSVYQKIIN